MYHIEVKISSAVLKKLLAGKTVTIKNQGEHSVTLVYAEANKKAFTKIKRNIKNLKGTRINNTDLHDAMYPDEVNGEGILKSLKKGFNKVGKSFEKFGNKVEKEANKNAGKYAETAKKFIPRQVVQGVINAGILAGATAIGQPELALPAQKAANVGVNTLYKKDFKKKGGWEKAAKDGVIQTAVDEALGAVKNSIKPTKAVIPTAVPIADVAGKGMRKRIMKPKLDLNINVGGSFKPVGGSFKPIGGKGFMPIR